jgi:hypothetical protein
MRSALLLLFLALYLCACNNKNNSNDGALNAALERTNRHLIKNNEQLLLKMEKAMANDEKKVRLWYDKAMAGKKMAGDLYKYIEDQKLQMVNEGRSDDNFATTLEEKLGKYEEALFNFVPEKDASGIRRNYFVSHPLTVDPTMLSTYQNDILSLENDVLDLFMKQIETGDGNLKFSHLEVVVIPGSTTVKAGSEYEATIYLAAFSSMGEQQVVIGNYDPASGEVKPVSDGSTITMSGGKANYSVTATGTGHKNLDGGLRMKMPDGTFRVFPFHSEYEVVK